GLQKKDEDRLLTRAAQNRAQVFAATCRATTVREWSRRSLLLVFAVLLVRPAAAQAPKTALLVLLGGDSKIWQAACQERGWQFLEAGSNSSGKSVDQRIKSLAAEVEEPKKAGPPDPKTPLPAAGGGGGPPLFLGGAHRSEVWAAPRGGGGK